LQNDIEKVLKTSLDVLLGIRMEKFPNPCSWYPPSVAAYREGVDGIRPQSEDLNLAVAPQSLDSESGLPAKLVQELWLVAEAASFDLSRDEFEQILLAVGAKHHFGLAPEVAPSGDTTGKFPARSATS
jgi:hypothetical protein